jgi:carbamoyl-phosphate synthase large subunit
LLPSRNDTTEYLYQEHIAGEELNVEACADQHGRLMSACCWRKLLSRNGETELAVTIQRPDLLAHGLRLAQLIGAVGPCDIDLIERGGLFYLIEFNMRFGGGYPVSQLAGAGFLERLLQAHRSQHVPLHTAYAPDIVMMKSLQPFGGPASRFSVRDSYRP